MVLYLQKQKANIPAELQHYLDKEDENLTLYYNKADDTSSKMDRILYAEYELSICSSVTVE